MDLSTLSPHMTVLPPAWLASEFGADYDNHEAVLEIRDPCGLHVIIAIHRPFFHPFLNRPTTLGGTRLGGKKMYPRREDAVRDALRLSGFGMSFKASLSGVDFGGAKAVLLLLADEPPDRDAPIRGEFVEMLLVYAKYLNLLGGLYVTAEDMNFSEKYLTLMAPRTRWVAGAGKEVSGSGNPSPYTARGIELAIERALVELFQDKWRTSHASCMVAGVGGVGLPLAKALLDKGHEVFIADTDLRQIERARSVLGPSVSVVPPEEAHRKEVTVYAPCARGGCLNEKTIPELRCRAVVGGANNQLATYEDGYRIHQRGILYYPDYVVNSGGLRSVALEFMPGGHTEQGIAASLRAIPKMCSHVSYLSHRDDRPTSVVADELARTIIAGKLSGKALWSSDS